MWERLRGHIGPLIVAIAIGAVLGTVTVNTFAYKIEQINSATRTLIRNGSFAVRTFDENGLPVSKDSRNRRDFISPFYVVHYGLIYSQLCPQYGTSTAYHWQEDPTEKYWNVPPDIVSMDRFRAAADWIVETVATDENGSWSPRSITYIESFEVEGSAPKGVI